MKYLTKYNSVKYPVGSIHATNEHGPLEVLGRVDTKRSDQYMVRFMSTGYETSVATSAIKKGAVKDYYSPVVYGKGYMGNGPNQSRVKGKTVRTYKLWTGMLDRCYSKNGKYDTYQERGIVVCDRWLNYQNFCDDIKDLKGYDAWLSGYGMSIDKDIKYNGTYSPESCVFITTKENSRESALRTNLADKGKATRFTPSKK